MALRLQTGIGEIDAFAFGQCRQNGLAIGEIGLWIVRAFDVRSEITWEIDGFTASGEFGAIAGNGHRDALSATIGHLASDGSLPNQIVQLEFIAT